MIYIGDNKIDLFAVKLMFYAASKVLYRQLLNSMSAKKL